MPRIRIRIRGVCFRPNLKSNKRSNRKFERSTINAIRRRGTFALGRIEKSQIRPNKIRPNKIRPNKV